MLILSMWRSYLLTYPFLAVYVLLVVPAFVPITWATGSIRPIYWMAQQGCRLAFRLSGVRLRVHLKIDTGMHRFGFRDDNLRDTLPEVVGSPHLEVDSVYPQFATAELTGHPLFAEQRERFEAVRAAAGRFGLEGVRWHAANSAALLRDPRTWYDAVRPGLLLYGIEPSPLETDLDLRPVMSVRSRIVVVKGMWPGESAGYGARFVADRPMRVAIIPAGSADGLDLRLAGRGSVLIGGARADIVTVAMDSLTVDVTAVPAGPGDDVVILGGQAGARIGAN